MGDDAVSFRLQDDVYQPALDGSDAVADTAASSGPVPSAKKWQRLLREYRVIEYVFAIILYIIARKLGKWMQIHDRALPRIEMRLNSTTSIWARDPDIDQEKRVRLIFE